MESITPASQPVNPLRSVFAGILVFRHLRMAARPRTDLGCGSINLQDAMIANFHNMGGLNVAIYPQASDTHEHSVKPLVSEVEDDNWGVIMGGKCQAQLPDFGVYCTHHQIYLGCRFRCPQGDDPMANLLLRSVLVLSLMFGLLFAVGVMVLTAIQAPLGYAILFALGILFLQYLLGPWILQLIYKIEWRDPKSVSPALAAFMDRVCEERKIPRPRFGIIHDGNPNAFTFGHYPGDARLVVTTGLLELLDGEECQAVVAHELGHIAHWDFVVMTLAAVVPLILYMIFFATRRMRGGRGRSGGYAALIGLISYIAYIVSNFIVLLLSRGREDYADRFSAEVTGDPNALGRALVKVAYGLAAAPAKQGKDDARMTAARAFGIFDPKVAQTLALSGAGSGG